MRITVFYWEAEGSAEGQAVFSGDEQNFPYWLSGLLSTGSFVHKVEVG